MSEQFQDQESRRAQDATRPLGTSGPKPKRAPIESAYLLVFEGDSSWVFSLPPIGEVLIGRAETAALRLQDEAISRLHAKIVITQTEAQVWDLNSQNGTFLNGERLVGARPLASGDSLGLGGATLVFHSGPRPQAPRIVVDRSHFRYRCDEEIERSRRSYRPWSVSAIQLGVGIADRPSVAATLAAQLRRIDLATWDGADRLLVLLVETDAEQALAATNRLLKALGRSAPQAKAGIASFPLDGLDLDTLVASARAAAQAAEGSKPAHAATSFRTIDIRGRRVIVADPAMSRLYDLLERLAATDLPVLVLGETGSGKDLAAAALHARSRRAEKPFLALNCAAIPEQLIESELFGHEKGAFSGAVTSKPGLMESAHGGTMFLDEIGDLPAAAQAKLLRVLETKRLRRLGDVRERDADVRIVAATHRDLQEDVDAGRFRRDLFFRLKGATVWIPPLRDRKAELPILAQVFLTEACARAGRAPMVISPGAMESLAYHPWPGNVRELQTLMEYVAAVVKGPTLEPWHLAQWIAGATPAEAEEPPTLTTPSDARAPFRPIRDEIRDLERSRMVAALEATEGNRKRAAELIGMPLRTFVTKLRVYGLQREP
jgi:DNA-binding NtrC family response regulator